MIQDLMQRYFGRTGNLILIREMRKLDLESLEELEDEQKIKLAEELTENVFRKVVSRQKKSVIFHEILRQLNISKKKTLELSEKTKESYLNSKNVL